MDSVWLEDKSMMLMACCQENKAKSIAMKRLYTVYNEEDENQHICNADWGGKSLSS